MRTFSVNRIFYNKKVNSEQIITVKLFQNIETTKKDKIMRTFVADIIPRIQRFSQKLDNLTLLTNQHWVVIDEIERSKNVYIFRNNNELLISLNGRVEKAKWEYLGHNSILIDRKNESFLLKHGFFDENILALKIDSKEEYAFLVNETKFDKELNSIEGIVRFLDQKYLQNVTKVVLPKDDKLSNNELQNNYFANYKIIRETSGWALNTGKYIMYEIEFLNKKKGKVYYKLKANQYFFTTANTVEYFDDMKTSAIYLGMYLSNE